VYHRRCRRLVLLLFLLHAQTTDYQYNFKLSRTKTQLVLLSVRNVNGNVNACLFYNSFCLIDCEQRLAKIYNFFSFFFFSSNLMSSCINKHRSVILKEDATHFIRSTFTHHLSCFFICQLLTILGHDFKELLLWDVLLFLMSLTSFWELCRGLLPQSNE